MVFELEDSSWIQRMGNNVTTNIKTALSLDPKGKKDLKTEKPKIGILSFEVANAMSKAVQLWQSLADQEVHRLRTEVLKSEAIAYLVSSDDNSLLGLACGEKLEDLNHVAAAVSRLGKKCQEPALRGFEHIYNDLLSGNIDARALEFLIKDMDRKIKKMERYIAATANLYQELEVLTDLEQSARKLQMNLHRQSNGNCNNGGGSDNNCNGKRDCGGGGAYYQRKIVWQRQEIKHLRDVSLWNTTYEKVVGLLARMVCTIYCRICSVFGSQALVSNSVSLPLQFYDDDDDDDENGFPAMSGPLEHYGRSPMAMSRGSMGVGMGHCSPMDIRFASGPLERCPVEANWVSRSGPILSRTGSRKGCQHRDLGSGPNVESQTSVSASRGSSPGRLFKECLNLNANHPPKRRSLYVEGAAASKSCNVESRYCETSTTSASTSGHTGNALYSVSQTEGLPSSGPIRYLHSGPIYNKSPNTRTQFGSKCKKLIQAPPSTLGGSALALHYANVIILIEKLVRFPHLIGHDARDDLYQMLPTSVRVALRSRLKSYAKNLSSTIYDAPLAADWKDALEKILGWLAPLAHNMLKWQSEHNFEQQQVVSRTNVLLLQTLYYADQSKTELTITELLVGLNYICRYEQEVRTSGLMECSSQDYDEYLEWHCST